MTFQDMINYTKAIHGFRKTFKYRQICRMFDEEIKRMIKNLQLTGEIKFNGVYNITDDELLIVIEDYKEIYKSHEIDKNHVEKNIITFYLDLTPIYEAADIADIIKPKN